MAMRVPIIVVVVVAFMATAAFWMDRAQRQTVDRDSDLRREDAALVGWPADRTFAWSFNTPKDDGDTYGLSLRIRSKTSTLPPGISPTFGGQFTPMSANEADDEFGPGATMVPAGQTGTGQVTVQLLDLSSIGAVSTRPGQNLRVLANVTLGGARIDLPSNRIFLPAGEFAGNSMPSQGDWVNRELYLMSFYVQNDRELTQYDVLLQQSADWAVHCGQPVTEPFAGEATWL